MGRSKTYLSAAITRKAIIPKTLERTGNHRSLIMANMSKYRGGKEEKA